MTPEQRTAQLDRNEAAPRHIMGSFPTYMRPSYSCCLPRSDCRERLGELGYNIVLYDIDTEDYKNDDPDLIQRSKDIFDDALSSGSPYTKSWLVIGHDAHEQTVHNLTEHMLQTMTRLVNYSTSMSNLGGILEATNKRSWLGTRECLGSKDIGRVQIFCRVILIV